MIGRVGGLLGDSFRRPAVGRVAVAGALAALVVLGTAGCSNRDACARSGAAAELLAKGGHGGGGHGGGTSGGKGSGKGGSDSGSRRSKGTRGNGGHSGHGSSGGCEGGGVQSPLPTWLPAPSFTG